MTQFQEELNNFQDMFIDIAARVSVANKMREPDVLNTEYDKILNSLREMKNSGTAICNIIDGEVLPHIDEEEHLETLNNLQTLVDVGFAEFYLGIELLAPKPTDSDDESFIQNAIELVEDGKISMKLVNSLWETVKSNQEASMSQITEQNAMVEEEVKMRNTGNELRPQPAKNQDNAKGATSEKLSLIIKKLTRLERTFDSISSPRNLQHMNGSGSLAVNRISNFIVLNIDENDVDRRAKLNSLRTKFDQNLIEFYTGIQELASQQDDHIDGSYLLEVALGFVNDAKMQVTAMKSYWESLEPVHGSQSEVD